MHGCGAWPSLHGPFLLSQDHHFTDDKQPAPVYLEVVTTLIRAAMPESLCGKDVQWGQLGESGHRARDEGS
jgi:hypothetical protein